MDHYTNAKHRSIRTLLVHDSPKMLKALSQIMATEKGFTVVGSATDGCQALRHATALGPELVLMGVHLSKLSAAYATDHMKHSVNPPVVFLVNPGDSSCSRAKSEAFRADAIIENSPDLDAGLRSRLHQWFRTKSAE